MLTMNMFNTLREMQRAFDEVFENSSWSNGLSSNGVYPSINIFERDDKYLLRAELPGLDKEKLNIQYQDGKLALEGTIVSQDLAKESVHRQERQKGHFNRILRLPERIDESRINAKYENGILNVELPFAEEAKPKLIHVS